MFGKVTILGVGLIGGSFGLALRKKGLCREVCGCGRSAGNLTKARDMGAIDSFTHDPVAACSDADLVMLSTPPGSFREIVLQIRGSLKKGAIVTDAGSVKGDLVPAVERMMPGGVYYVGAHPIAGSELSGAGAATGTLFEGARCIITPTAQSDPAALGEIRALWERIGAVVVEMDPAQHDRVYAAVSHLPHLIAFTLVNTVGDIDRAFLDFAGQGFRDMTRIAGSPDELWRDICMMNRKNLISMIGVFQKNLALLNRHLEAEDEDALGRDIGRARQLRDSIGHR